MWSQKTTPTSKTPAVGARDRLYVSYLPSYSWFCVFFVTMATRVHPGQISMTPLICPTSKTPCLAQEIGSISYRQSYSQFCVKFPIFSLPWRQGSLWPKCQWRRWIARPRKPPSWYKIIGHISYIGRVIANFVLKFPFFRYHSNQGSSGLNVNDTVELPDLETPLVGARFSAVSYISWVVANFLSKNSQLVAIATRVSVGQISMAPLDCQTPKTPSLVQTSWLYL